MNRKNLMQRIFFALWAGPAGWWVINSEFAVIPCCGNSLNITDKILPGHVLAIALVLFASLEYLSMLAGLFKKNGFWLAFIWMIYQFISYFIPSISIGYKFDIYLLLSLVAMETVVWGEKASGRWRRASLLFSGMVFLSICGFSLLDFYNGSLQKVFPSRFESTMFSQMGIITLVASIFLCDTAAFFIGNIFGRHKFSSVSPHKTIEGSVAGFIAAVAVSTIGWYFFADTVKFPLYLAVIMGVIVGIFAQLGDLLVSLIKRYFNVKDTSTIIPGHGGILDRFDSVFFTAPVINVYLLLITKFIN